jgi:periplasmic mercuric ion binding protein
MITMRIYFAIALLFGVLSVASAQENQATAGNRVETVAIQTSAQCGMCQAKIEKALFKAPGVVTGTLDLETMIVTVKYDSKTTGPEAIRTLIASVGYDADDVAADPEAYAKLPRCCQKGGHDH